MTAVVVALAMIGFGAGSVVTVPLAGAMPVLLDYSPTISDIGALFFLASHPDVDLLAVTLPERGESDCDHGVRHTRSLLAIAGRPDVAVGCGVEPPLEFDRDWPGLPQPRPTRDDLHRRHLHRRGGATGLGFVIPIGGGERQCG